ncbi:MAG: ribosome maturation factor RimP [Pyrinomonadaceae bacterium]|nr:ribosome maturation factor RimP [Pyrinomonadaceae bacterium]
MGTEEIASRIRELAVVAAEKQGVELVHVEIGSLKNKRVVRIFIDKEGGVTHDDCAHTSREIENLLDSEDPIKGEYLLEVSSPGIERGLYSLEDFDRFAGSDAKLKTVEAIGGQKNFRGRIKGILDGNVEIEDVSSGAVSIPYESVKKANLSVDLDGELQQSRKQSR